MKTDFCIVSDGSCDLPEQVDRENDISVIHFLVSFDGTNYKREGEELDLKDFYQHMVDEPRSFPMTAAPSPEAFYQVFLKKAREGQNIICVCISTKLSSSIQSAQIARRMLQEEYPDIRVAIIDSLCATLMQSAYVLELCRLRDTGCSFDRAVTVMEALRSTARIFFTVGNLDYIQHGGRIGRMTGIAGNLLNIKPVITLQDGEIHSSGLKRGRQKSLCGIIDLLVSYLGDNQCTPDDCNIIIGYGYDYEEACRLQEMTIQRLNALYESVPSIPVFQIGATIGVHAGPYSIGFGIVRRSDRFQL